MFVVGITYLCNFIELPTGGAGVKDGTTLSKCLNRDSILETVSPTILALYRAIDK
jgi:hypothetical protein